MTSGLRHYFAKFRSWCVPSLAVVVLSNAEFSKFLNSNFKQFLNRNTEMSLHIQRGKVMYRDEHNFIYTLNDRRLEIVLDVSAYT